MGEEFKFTGNLYGGKRDERTKMQALKDAAKTFV
ncbi:MAG: hypothetical protein JWP23_2814, partial [Phenylobacterium sp.]|nr:hypothetical protein [Phenylobacterium sp.]